MKEIKLTQNKVAVVDDVDFERLSKHKWFYHSAGYAIRNVPKKDKKIGSNFIFMHRFIMDAPKGMEVDHKNGNGLDNQRENLRVCTHKLNLANQGTPRDNKSGYKGVIWHLKNQNWVTHINVNHKTTHIGSFKTAHQAALAYDLWAKDLFGEYAKLNFKGVIHG